MQESAISPNHLPLPGSSHPVSWGHSLSLPPCTLIFSPLPTSNLLISTHYPPETFDKSARGREKREKQRQARNTKLAMARSCFLILGAVAMLLALAPASLAGDPDMVQDVCVADLTSAVKVNGFPCKASVTAEDFYSAVLAKPGATNNTMGSLVTGANVEKVPGLNTLGVSLSRIDYAPGGLNPPHTHPRATEMVFVLEGTLDVGFITTANKHIAKTITKGDVFVFPRGLVHFQKNNGDAPAAVISAFNSQLPGTQSIAVTLFAATPAVPDHVLTKAFQVGTKEVEKIKSRLAPKKS